MANIIGVVQIKGGAGRSTLATNLAMEIGQILADKNALRNQHAEG